ncbi:MAG: SIS domain-containing protein [bacterium]
MGEILKKIQSSQYQPVFGSLKAMPAQFKSALTQKLDLPADFKKIKNIVLCGMGGSALAAHILEALNICLTPFYFYNGYEPPRSLNKDTLFIASSYSGTTEEVLASLKKAEATDAKIVGLAAGGELLETLKKKGHPFIKFDDKYNPSGQPRYGLGYALGGLLNILCRLGFADLKIEEVEAAADKIKMPALAVAEKIAKQLQGFSPIVVASEFLAGNAHILANQFNETCKTFSEFHIIPELNHHLLEGLKRPADNKLKFLFIESGLYSKRISHRFDITKKVVKNNNIGYTEYRVNGQTKLEQALNCLSLGGLVSVVLAIIYKEDPVDIPWVNYFKKELQKIS